MIRIWKLTPIDLSNPIWKCWSPDPIFVRADTEADARHLAELKTAKFDSSKCGQPLAINPWSNYKKIEDPAPLPTLCEDVTHQTIQYSVDGPAEVLHHSEGF